MYQSAPYSVRSPENVHPTGKITAGGMKVVEDIYNVGEAPSQARIQSEGNAYLNKDFPQLSYIKKVTIVA